MPELPEVETTRRGLLPLLLHRTVDRVVVRERRLRWPVPAALSRELTGMRIDDIARRAKYLLLRSRAGSVILHLGMSGSLRVLPDGTPPEKHDHVDLVFDGNRCLRLRDTRRFGAVLWTRRDPLQHSLLRDLGPEPLGNAFDGECLYQHARGRRIAVKSLIMNGRVVVGVGNIYASEALFLAGIHPNRPAGRISLERYRLLAETIRRVLSAAIEAGGTTLRDFSSNGEPGYFGQRLRVYARRGEACEGCGEPIRQRVIGQRSTFYCPRCQR